MNIMEIWMIIDEKKREKKKILQGYQCYEAKKSIYLHLKYQHKVNDNKN